MASLVVPSSFCRISSSSVRSIVSAGLVWSGLVWSLCSSSSERGWTKKIENQNADESEDIIVILAYFSVFELKKVVI